MDLSLRLHLPTLQGLVLLPPVVEDGSSGDGSIVAGDRSFRVRLPGRWSPQTRSTILHAVSLARIALLREELRIKDARMERVPPHHRPHYPATDRLGIVELRAARGWSAAQKAERFFVTEATIADWMARLDEDGPAALVRTPDPSAGSRTWLHTSSGF